MDGPAKRLLKEEDTQQRDIPAQPSTPVDYSLQLRNIGARVRRSVAQGYLTPPSQSSFTKYQSTNTIFRSEKDTLRDVFSSPESTVANAASFPNKRNRSMEDEPPNTNIDLGGTPANHSYRSAMDLEGDGFNPRPIKPLRNSRRTQSDSTLTLSDSNQSRRQQVEEMTPAFEAEEDWSLMETDNPADTGAPFTPLSF